MKLNARGFTFVELVVAMAISSMTLLVMSAGVIRLYNIYQGGNEIRNTQQAARLVAEEITREARAGVAVAVGPTVAGNQQACIFGDPETGPGGGLQYSGVRYFTEGGPTATAVSVLYREDVTKPYAGTTPQDCSSTTPRSPKKALTNPAQVSVTEFSPSVSPAYDASNTLMQPNLLSYGLKVASSANLGAINATTKTCEGGVGSQYCSVTSLNTAVFAQGGAQQ